MLAVVSAIVGGLMYGLKVTWLSWVVYLLKFRKSVFLVAFSAYCLALGYELEVSSVYDMDPAVVFAIVLPTILILDAGLKGEQRVFVRDRYVIDIVALLKEHRDIVSYILSVAIVVGYFVKVLFVIAVTLAVFHHFSKDNPRMGAWVALAGASMLILGLALSGCLFNMPGSASTQVVFISAVSILLALAFWREVEKLEL
jgi:hypothetical protein